MQIFCIHPVTAKTGYSIRRTIIKFNITRSYIYDISAWKFVIAIIYFGYRITLVFLVMVYNLDTLKNDRKRWAGVC